MCLAGDLDKICERAGNGDANAVKQATKEVCLKIVNATVPASAPASALDQAKAACNSAG